MSKRKYDPETKAAVLAELMKGQSASFVADEYDIPVGTVKGWKSRELSGTATVVTEKKERIGELLVEYLEESIKTLIVQVRHFRDRDWLREQGAESLAMLHGVHTDKVTRMIEALGRAESTD